MAAGRKVGGHPAAQVHPRQPATAEHNQSVFAGSSTRQCPGSRSLQQRLVYLVLTLAFRMLRLESLKSRRSCPIISGDLSSAHSAKCTRCSVWLSPVSLPTAGRQAGRGDGAGGSVRVLRGRHHGC